MASIIEMTNTAAEKIRALLSAVPTNVESPVPSQPRLTVRVDVRDNGTVQVVMIHTKHGKQAIAEINAYKKEISRTLRAACFPVYTAGGLEYLFSPTCGSPKDGLIWQLNVRPHAPATVSGVPHVE